MLVAAFSAVVAFGALSGPAGAKGDVRADSSWGPAVAVQSAVGGDSSWGVVSPMTEGDSSWGVVSPMTEGDSSWGVVNPTAADDSSWG
ncbi:MULTISPECIES: hypothetical protein [unclassified Streptomyces]|uniref:hypothetical protein n=1 Tax=unclassified Streptomyces TaxID=2593676 RepID=UPI001F3F0803|nr:hypothetical protein [Streptomyces sp. NBRC 110035]